MLYDIVAFYELRAALALSILPQKHLGKIAA